MSKNKPHPVAKPEVKPEAPSATPEAPKTEPTTSAALSQMAALPPPAATAPLVTAKRKAKVSITPKSDSKHGRLLAALATPQTKEQLMKASGFDDKNTAVAMGNLKRAGHVIKCVRETIEGKMVSLYSLVNPEAKPEVKPEAPAA
jgi:hypothetical protein